RANPGLFDHLLYEKTYCGLFDNAKIREHVPSFVCEWTLEKGLRAICDWYESDSAARITDPEKERLENELCDMYEAWMNQIAQ
ncbi:MAG: hypothetical protein Q4D04_11905, partial [Clostridia bacterium]|nr:hypothetical protein [Clostridia bacterium]